jgi:serine/threonine protein kinase
MENLIGKDLGRYHILEHLGEGGMATVYKAYDTRLERDVAVKIIRTELFGSAVLERLLKRFEREAKTLARLTHPNIVGVIEYGEFEGSPYLVMPYLPGGTLKQRLGRPMPWQEAVRLLLPIAQALEYAHEHNIVHRDIKPSNILLAEKGQPMLSDFGIAKILKNEETGLTSTGMGIGTPEYMAPEQWTGMAGPLADLYSLGVVLYELVTGHKPYTADTPAAIMLKQATDPLPRPRQFAPDLPEALEKVLFKALAKQPEDRYQSMGEFTNALEKILAFGRTIESVEKSKEISREEEDKTLLVEVPEKKTPEEKKDIPEFSKAGPVAGRLGRLLPWAGGALLIVFVTILAIVLINHGLKPPAMTATPTLATILPIDLPVDTYSSTNNVNQSETPTFTLATPTDTDTLSFTISPTLVVTDTPSYTRTPVLITGIVNTFGSSYLYAGPSTYHKKVLCDGIACLLSRGEQVIILEKNNNFGEIWYLISTTTGKTGWLFRNWLLVNGDLSTIPTAAYIPTYPPPPIPTKTPKPAAPSKPQYP